MRTEDEIKADIRATRERLGQLKAELSERLLVGVAFRVGDRVRVTAGRRAGKVFEVTRVEPWAGNGTASLYGSMIRKDGKPSANEMWIGPDEDVTPIQAA